MFAVCYDRRIADRQYFTRCETSLGPGRAYLVGHWDGPCPVRTALGKARGWLSRSARERVAMRSLDPFYDQTRLDGNNQLLELLPLLNYLPGECVCDNLIEALTTAGQQRNLGLRRKASMGGKIRNISAASETRPHVVCNLVLQSYC